VEDTSGSFAKSVRMWYARIMRETLSGTDNEELSGEDPLEIAPNNYIFNLRF
jgi:hypothetical protein